jgi:quinol monooxygenase YgiN
MVLEYVRYKIPQEKRETFISNIKQASKIMKDSAFVLYTELTNSIKEEENFIWRIEWTSIEDQLNGFRNSKEFERFFRLVQPFLNNIQERNHYKSID